MKKKKFIGRAYEIQRLEEQLACGLARLIVMQGRRRIGKSRLIEEFVQTAVA